MAARKAPPSAAPASRAPVETPATAEAPAPVVVLDRTRDPR